MESDIVTGDVAKKTETQTGAFPLAYKQSPGVLTGQNAENGWNVNVSYWMPFFDGQGLHDATWRSSFGGNIYLTNGSHGCVNLPWRQHRRFMIILMPEWQLFCISSRQRCLYIRHRYEAERETACAPYLCFVSFTGNRVL